MFQICWSVLGLHSSTASISALAELLVVYVWYLEDHPVSWQQTSCRRMWWYLGPESCLIALSSLRVSGSEMKVWWVAWFEEMFLRTPVLECCQLVGRTIFLERRRCFRSWWSVGCQLENYHQDMCQEQVTKVRACQDSIQEKELW